MQRHVDSLLSLLIKAVKSLLKRVKIIAHSLVLISKRNAKLKAANKATTQRKSHKRK
jgi:heme exporter protein D